MAARQGGFPVFRGYEQRPCGNFPLIVEKSAVYQQDEGLLRRVLCA